MHNRFLFFFFLLFFSAALSAQRPDSFPAKDTSPGTVETVRSEFQRWQDSVNRVRLKRFQETSGQSLDQFLAEMKERESRAERKKYILLSIGAIFLLAVMFRIIQLRKRKGKGLR